jgi:ElaB/YqjD/DUF883 family membrane-anchored ribosome-binding protein
METYFNNLSQDVTTEKLVEDLQLLVSDAEQLVKVAGGNLGEKSKAELNSALERIKAGCRKMEVKVASGAQRANLVIREHPYQSMGVALGLGVLIGILVKRD